jgi:uncharacterized protein involved in exopolysaccharide biosynthesis
MTAPTIEQMRSEPTVFGAVRRYRMMVVAVALITAAIAVGYTLVAPETYRASASLTVPQQVSLQSQGTEQYLDSQILLLQSQDVAQRAVRIANAALGSSRLAVSDFYGEYKSLEITPPDKATPGTYGASTITVSFTWSDARIAEVGANALLQAFDEARSAAIRAQGDATLAAITKAMADARTLSNNQNSDLLNQRMQALVNQQIDLVHHPTVAWAAQPQIPTNANKKNAAAIGLLIGTVLGSALAFARASRAGPPTGQHRGLT